MSVSSVVPPQASSSSSSIRFHKSPSGLLRFLKRIEGPRYVKILLLRLVYFKIIDVIVKVGVPTTVK